MEQELQQAVAFFQSESAYQTLFAHFKKKYESLGRIGGTVPVRLFSTHELEVIGAFFSMPGSQLAKKRSISLRAFEKQLADTRFGAIGLKQLLDAFFAETIKSNKQHQQEKDAALRQFIIGLKRDYKSLAFWFDDLLENSSDVRWVWALMEKEPERVTNMISQLHDAYKHLPSAPERLPMFSQRITGDPHAFDLQTDTGKLWLHILASGIPQRVPSSTEAINDLLQHYHIYRDDLLNFVTCAGLLAETSAGIHPVWQAAVHNNTVRIVPLRELIDLTAAYPPNGSDVWIVENSGVCATLLDHKPDVSIVCTNGQFTLASIMLLDKLAGSGVTLNYAGDFDPEGLGMAERLLSRYPEGYVNLWHMDAEAYAASNPVKKLPAERLEQLHRIEHPKLAGVANAMHAKGKAGYQEALIARMVADIS